MVLARRATPYPLFGRLDSDRGVLDDVRLVVPAVEQVNPPARIKMASNPRNHIPRMLNGMMQALVQEFDR
jgi:hypothetical protein